MYPIAEAIGKLGLVPVVALDDAQKALPLVDAMTAGGLPCAEITFRTEAAEEAIRLVAQNRPEVLLGAGTVLSVEQADRAIAAGAAFIVSPGFNPRVVDHCMARGVPIVPGCSGPSDMEQALQRGLDVVKVFPAGPLGGVEYLKAVAGPFPALRFMATGGVSPANLGEYLAFEKVLACGGSWMVPKALLARGAYEEITALCREAFEVMLAPRVQRIGLRAAGEAAAKQAAELLGSLLALRPGEAGAIEVLQQPGPGERGCISLGVRDVARGRALFERRGFAFQSGAENSGEAVLEGDLLGFALKLVKAV